MGENIFRILANRLDVLDREAIRVQPGNPLATSTLLEVARGGLPGVSCITKFGRNTAVGGAREDVWTQGGIYPFMQIAAPLRIQVGGNPGDTAAGAGAQSVIMIGLDGNLNEITETIATAGAAASLFTAQSFFRLFRAFPGAVGTYGGTNLGPILIENAAATVFAEIAADLGQTQMAIFTIPNGKRGLLARLWIQIESTRAADVTVWRRENADVVAGAMGPRRIISGFNQVTNELNRSYACYRVLAGKADVWVSAEAATAPTALSAEMGIFLVDD